MLIELLKEMFEEMVVKKNAELIPKYYHEHFVLETNQEKMDYASFLSSHQKIYKTDIHYRIRYDEETLFEFNDKIGGRVWITTQLPGQKAKEIEVMLIVKYVDDKIIRLWELTQRLPANS